MKIRNTAKNAISCVFCSVLALYSLPTDAGLAISDGQKPGSGEGDSYANLYKFYDPYQIGYTFTQGENPTGFWVLYQTSSSDPKPFNKPGYIVVTCQYVKPYKPGSSHRPFTVTAFQVKPDLQTPMNFPLQYASPYTCQFSSQNLTSPQLLVTVSPEPPPYASMNNFVSWTATRPAGFPFMRSLLTFAAETSPSPRLFSLRPNNQSSR